MENEETKRPSNKKGGKRTQKLVNHLVLIAVAGAVIVGLAIGIVGVVEIDNAYTSMTEEELKSAAKMLEDIYQYSYPGEWAEIDGILYKGEADVSDDVELLDDIQKKTDIDFTLFLGPTREVTTLIDENGNRIVGTDASETVVAKVLNGGGEISS